MHRDIQWLQSRSGDDKTTTTSYIEFGERQEAHAMKANMKCRNSRQGREWITYENGYICTRQDLLSSGCCDINNSIQYSCQQCNSTNACCRTYENCVSCCMLPDNRSHLASLISILPDNRLRSFVDANDHFEMCLVKCRTSSQSITKLSKYMNETHKHCYRDSIAKWNFITFYVNCLRFEIHNKYYDDWLFIHKFLAFHNVILTYFIKQTLIYFSSIVINTLKIVDIQISQLFKHESTLCGWENN